VIAKSLEINEVEKGMTDSIRAVEVNMSHVFIMKFSALSSFKISNKNESLGPFTLKQNNMFAYGHPTDHIFQPPTLTFFIGNYSTNFC
jgi:hypothetical protein